jgi:hypothetical protein
MLAPQPMRDLRAGLSFYVKADGAISVKREGDGPEILPRR